MQLRDFAKASPTYQDIHDIWEEQMRAGRFDLLPKPSGLVPIVRGGLVPATILSHMWGVPIIGVVFMDKYSEPGRERQIPYVAGGPEYLPEDAIFVDDVLDTGDTFRAVNAVYPKNKFLVPYAKYAGLNTCSHMLHSIPLQTVVDVCWLYFPWEKKDA